MIDNEVENMVNEQAQRMQSQGIQLEMYLQYMGQTIDEYKQSIRGVAQPRVKSNLVLEAISKDLKIEATAEEYDKEMDEMAKAYNMEKENILKALGDDNEFVKENIVSRKTVEYLEEKAVKTEPKAEEKAEEEKKDEE